LDKWLFGKKLVIFGMRPDPKPLNTLWDWHAKGPVINSDPDAAEAPAMHGFES
jgi:hypothetical protein